jgi:hypothetical protein
LSSFALVNKAGKQAERDERRSRHQRYISSVLRAQYRHFEQADRRSAYRQTAGAHSDRQLEHADRQQEHDADRQHAGKKKAKNSKALIALYNIFVPFSAHPVCCPASANPASAYPVSARPASANSASAHFALCSPCLCSPCLCSSCLCSPCVCSRCLCSPCL